MLWYPLCLKDLVGVFYALLQAVEALHVSGCVHGGIAPSKVSIKKSKSELIAILREPNFSSDEVTNGYESFCRQF